MSNDHDNTTHAPGDDTGFAALEARVEQVQSEAAGQTGAPAATAPEDASPSAAMMFTPGTGDLFPAPIAAGGNGATTAWLSAYLAWLQGSLIVQSDALRRFTQVRGPADLFTAQMAYAQDTMNLCLTGLSRGSDAGAHRI